TDLNMRPCRLASILARRRRGRLGLGPLRWDRRGDACFLWTRLACLLARRFLWRLRLGIHDADGWDRCRRWKIVAAVERMRWRERLRSRSDGRRPGSGRLWRAFGRLALSPGRRVAADIGV